MATMALRGLIHPRFTVVLHAGPNAVCCKTRVVYHYFNVSLSIGENGICRELINEAKLFLVCYIFIDRLGCILVFYNY